MEIEKCAIYSDLIYLDKRKSFAKFLINRLFKPHVVHLGKLFLDIINIWI